jgi:hypothetical protein
MSPRFRDGHKNTGGQLARVYRDLEPSHPPAVDISRKVDHTEVRIFRAAALSGIPDLSADSSHLLGL